MKMNDKDFDPLELAKLDRLLAADPDFPSPSRKEIRRMKKRFPLRFKKLAPPEAKQKSIRRGLIAGAAALLLAGSIAYALRGEIGNLFIEKHEEYISANNQGQGGGWMMDDEYPYLPMYVPDGFVISSSPDQQSGDIGVIEYSDGKKYFFLYWANNGSNLFIDYSEREDAEIVQVGDLKGGLTIRDEQLRLFWGVNPQFLITGNIDRDEIMRVAESVVHIHEKDVDIKNEKKEGILE